MSQFSYELVCAVTQRIATVEVEAAIRRHTGIRLRIHRKNCVSDRIDSARRNLIEWKCFARRRERIINASSADAVSIGIYLSNLREVTRIRNGSAALQQRWNNK